MKILLSYDDRIRHDSTAIYFKKAFESLLGKENVTHVYPEDINDVERAYDFFLKIDDGLSSNRWNPNLHPSGYYVIDCHIDLDWRLELEKESNFDFLFFSQKAALEAPWKCQSLHWVPLAADEDLHFCGPVPKIYDVCFIGNFHSRHAKKRLDLCDRLFREFPNFYYGTAFFKDMAKKFAQSRLVWNYGLNKDINMRFFEAMMSGSALLTDFLPESSELGFVEGRDYIGYGNADEMISKARHYLQNEVERESIARSGWELVREFHKYKNRVTMIMSVISMAGVGLEN